MASDAFRLQGTIDVDVKDAVDSLNKVRHTLQIIKICSLVWE